jgi:hypothetical protein
LTVTVSLVLVLGIAVFVLCRYTGLRVWQAVICILLGFVLASSSLAPDISQVLNELLHML